MMRRAIQALLGLLLLANLATAQVTTNPGITNVPATRGQLPGTTTSDTACTGCVGEIIENTSCSVTTTSAADLCTISLTPGQWTVFGKISNGAPGSATYGLIGVSTTSATLPGGHGQNYFSLGASLAAGGGMVATYFKLASTTTVYLVGQANASTTYAGTIWAVRTR